MITLRSGGWVRLMFVGFLLLVPLLAAGKTVTVTPGEKGGIYAALASANAGDVILVACGTYYEGALYIPDGVSLIGNPADPTCVRIETSGVTSLITFMDAGLNTVISGFTLAPNAGGMHPPVARGGGIFIKDSSPRIQFIIFEGLEADYGGAVYIEGLPGPDFHGCTFKGNYARAAGGAVALAENSYAEFVECLFVDNTAEASGGTINAAFSGVFMYDSTIVGGSGAVGSGIASWGGWLELGNTIIVDGLTGRAWDGDASSAPLPECTDIFNNEGGDWVGALEPHASSHGNISLDPQFCGAADSDNPYTLNEASPCARQNSLCGEDIGAFGVNCSYTSDVGDGEAGLPVASRLHSNYPNPFNPRTTIKFDLKEAGPVELAVYDLGGRLVKKLVGETMAAGHHHVVWEGKDTSGRATAAGVYFFRLKTTDTIDTKRMTLIK